MTKQVINIGTSANDGTGDTLRAAMDICNDNFTELYSRQGPVSGSLYPDVINAVKYIEINEIQRGDLFCITEIKCAVANGSDYDYLIEISRVSAIAGSPEAICRYEATVSSLKTGLTLVSIPEYSGSAYYAKMVINWSLLTAGTDYQMANYADGALFAINVNSARFNDNESSIQTISSGDNSQVLDGSKRLYRIPVVAEGQIVTLCPVEDAVGDVIITCSSPVEELLIYAKTTDKIEGVTAGLITIESSNAFSMKLIPLKSEVEWVIGDPGAANYSISSDV
jgi:hypothetical protein